MGSYTAPGGNYPFGEQGSSARCCLHTFELFVGDSGFYNNPTCGAKALPSDHIQEGWDVPFGENTSWISFV